MIWHPLGISFACALPRVLLLSSLALSTSTLAQNPPVPAPTPAPAPSSANQPILSGRITDQAGKPVPAAQVTLMGPSYERTKADAQGNYSFPRLRAPGEYRIMVEANGFPRLDPYASGQSPLQLAADSRLTHNITLQRGCSIVVTVTDSSGEPLANVTVYVSPKDRRYTGGQPIRVETDSGGLATTTLPVSKAPQVVTVTKKGFAPAHTLVTPASAEEPVDVNIALEPGQSVRGIALCSDGQPATGWRICAYPEWWTSPYSPEGATIGKDGSFTIDSLGSGKYTLQLTVPVGDRMYTSKEVGSLTVPVAEQPVRLNMPVASPGSRVKLAGKVRVIGARPANLSIQATSDDGEWYHAQVDFSNARPNKDGAFESTYSLGNVPPGTYRIQFNSDAAGSQVLQGVKVPGDVPVAELKAVAKPHLTGSVTDPAGKPLPQFSLRIRKLMHLGDTPGYIEVPTWRAISEPQGRFDVELPSAGVYQVQALADGYAATWGPEIRLDPGAVKAETTLALTLGGALSGTVVDPSGKPVAGAKVIPFSLGGNNSYAGRVSAWQDDTGAITTDSAGRFSFPHLAPGGETLRILHPQFARHTIEKLNVTDNQTTDLGQVALVTGGIVEGTVYDTEGNPDPGVTLRFQDDPNERGPREANPGLLATVITDDAGHYRVEHLPQQPVYVMPAEPWSRQGVINRLVRPTDGKVCRADLGGSSTVRGRLMNSGKPVANTTVQFAGPYPYGSPFQARGKTDAEGQFTIRGIPQGHYWIHYYAQRGTVLAGEANVAGSNTDLGTIAPDTGDLVITVDASQAEGAQVGEMIMVQGDGIVPAHYYAQLQGDHWLAKGIPVGKYRIVAPVKGTALSVIAAVERKPGAGPMSITLRVPRLSATLTASVAKPEKATAAWTRSAVLANQDGTIRANIPTADSKPVTLKLPPGTYRVAEGFIPVSRPDLDPIVLAEGDEKSAALHLEYPKGQAPIALSLPVWSADGLFIHDANPRLTDAQGTTISPTAYTSLGASYRLQPGHYRATLDRPGAQPLTRDFDLAPSDTPRQQTIDLVLPPAD